MNSEPEKPVVLVVDDTPTNLSVLIEALSYAGLNVSVARSGTEALERVKWVAPDVILLDVIMPGIDGFETCRRLKKNEATADIPVIFMTALSETVDKVTGFEAGGVDYITKPFQEAEVLARINAHLTIRRQQKQLQELNASKDKFFSIIAHDLKNPLISFLAFANVLEEIEFLDPEQFKQFAEQFKASAENLFALLENLLTWSRVQRGMIECQPQYISITNVVVGNVRLLTPNVEKKQITLRHVVEEDFLVYADVNMLDTVIRNLITNAIKFTPPGGTIEVVAKGEEDMVTVSVSDTGIGIPEDKLAGLFEIGVQAQRAGTEGEKGTGLGLILCAEFINKNGGEIWVESQIGEGSTFSFQLPGKRATS